MSPMRRKSALETRAAVREHLHGISEYEQCRLFYRYLRTANGGFLRIAFRRNVILGDPKIDPIRRDEVAISKTDGDENLKSAATS